MKKFFLILVLFVELFSVEPKSVYISILEKPNKIFFHQRFKVKYKILITNEYSDINISFIPNESVSILNNSSPWKIENNNTLINTFYFKALKNNVEIPKLEVKIFEDSKLIDKSTTKIIKYKAVRVKSKIFCGVIATKVNLIDTIIKQSSNKDAIAVFEIEGFDSNLEDFNLKWFEDSNIESYEDDLNYQRIFYYTKIPIGTKEIIFSYFNIKDESFHNIKVPIEIEEILSTQSDLNPEQSRLSIFKILIFSFFIFIFLLFYLKSKSKIHLLFIIILLFFMLLQFLPLKEVIVKKGANIKVLPTYKSTIFKTLSKDTKVKVLNYNEKYVKILLPDDKIGWVSKKDVK